MRPFVLAGCSLRVRRFLLPPVFERLFPAPPPVSKRFVSPVPALLYRFSGPWSAQRRVGSFSTTSAVPASSARGVFRRVFSVAWRRLESALFACFFWGWTSAWSVFSFVRQPFLNGRKRWFFPQSWWMFQYSSAYPLPCVLSYRVEQAERRIKDTRGPGSTEAGKRSASRAEAWR